MVFRVFVEKRAGYMQEANALYEDIRSFLGITALAGLRVLNRYDVEGVDEALMDTTIANVFSEPMVDQVFSDMPGGADRTLIMEYLPGQFDQRAASAEECVQLLTGGLKPTVRTAKVYLMYGDLDENAFSAIRGHLINPVESREASHELPETLQQPLSEPEPVPVLTGFTSWTQEQLKQAVSEYGLAMDAADVACCQRYFKEEERRDPTLTELRILDTYWSDHCRHTTFLTQLKDFTAEDPDVAAAYDEYLKLRRALNREDKPVTLMDMATIGARYLEETGVLTDLDVSPEINACTIKVNIPVDGKDEEWLLLFKNETHNHPTEIEPFGGAATCIGGAIRDPLSGRAYVYQAMRVTGAGNPLTSLNETIPGKLPQRKLTTTAAAGYSAYGNQIGLATGLVEELYHPGYVAKRMEIGAVIGAAPAKNVVRQEPTPGDVVILLGGRTGRDGCGGATGSSKAHKRSSLFECGAEVQKGNAPEERKLQRLMRNPEATRLIKRCNDFGAGGVSVAIGELADGLWIDLNAVPKKYEGLTGTELAISESQERMAVVIAKDDAKKFLRLADGENLSATVVATVTEEPRLTMTWNGQTVADVSRAFLDTNGAKRSAAVRVGAPKPLPCGVMYQSLQDALKNMAGDLNSNPKRGLVERFDSTVGAGTVLMPFGGKYQRTPIQTMVAKLPVLDGETDACSFMSWGGDPYALLNDPFRGAYLAVVESVGKLAAAGADVSKCHLTFQEYFPKLSDSPERWGLPASALLGALKAQMALQVGAIGGKDSMSGSFEDMNVPPTLISFAVGVGRVGDVLSPEFKSAGNHLVYLQPELGADKLPTGESLLSMYDTVRALRERGALYAAYVPGRHGVLEAVVRMGLGNRLGVAFCEDVTIEELIAPGMGGLLLELDEELTGGRNLGVVQGGYAVTLGGEGVALCEVEAAMDALLEPVFPTRTKDAGTIIPCDYRAEVRPKPRRAIASPRVLIPVFPGTNCEYDTARAFRLAGARPEILVVNNQSPTGIAQSVARFASLLGESQILCLPGGFSAGDEPDGSGKFITAFLRNPAAADAVRGLLEKGDGLALGICNGFQALIKLGLVPYGDIRQAQEDAPTLTYNTIGRHQSRLVYTRVASNKSPWLMYAHVGDVKRMPISHGEGRFVCAKEELKKLFENGQVATQYCDPNGVVSMDIDVNPNGSFHAVEGITSPDGRVFGKMGHSERYAEGLYKNVPGEDDMLIFKAAVDYFM